MSHSKTIDDGGHTPGPWTVKNHVHITAAGDIIASVKGKFGDPAKSANARLIGAAPDLLEALKELLSACEDDCGAVGDLTEFDGDDEPVGGGLNNDGSPDPMALTFGHLRRAARAIAKAEGRASLSSTEGV